MRRGRIDVSWRADEQLKTFKLNISYPQGVDLKIIAPEGYAAEIKETVLQQE
ncbi:hypothetical protein D3C81_784420 [compost metagenome]